MTGRHNEPVGVSVGSYVGDRGHFLRFYLSGDHLREIGDPERIEIRGQPANGFILSASESGLKLNRAALKGGAAYLQSTLNHFDLSRKERKKVNVLAEIADGQIRIPALPAAWLNATGEFSMEEPSTAAKPAFEAAVLIEPAAPSISPTAPPARPVPVYTVPADATMAQLQRELGVKLNEVRDIIKNMEERTGMKFILDRNLHLVVAL